MNIVNVIIGLGAQKAGTSWLNAALSQNAPICYGARKEKHILDFLIDDPQLPRKVKSPANLINLFEKIFSRPVLSPCSKLITNCGRLVDCEENFELICRAYAKSIVKEVALEGSNYFLDITPSYTCLQSHHYSTINKILTAEGVKIHFIYIMRDPISRIISAAKMRINRKNLIKKNLSLEQILSKFYSIYPEKNSRFSRGNYTHVITSLNDSQVNEKNILYLFYENLFTSKSYTTISEFLNLSLKEPSFDTVVHKSLQGQNQAIDISISAFTLECLRKSNKEIYEFCFNYFLNEIPNEWKNNVESP